MDRQEGERARRRRQEREYRRPLGIVSLSNQDKKKAIRKLGAVYGIVRPRWTWPELAGAVARALKILVPESVVDRAGMIHAFCREIGVVRPAGEDRVAMLRDRHPFRPLQTSEQMARQLERVRAFRELGRSSNGSSSR